MYADRRLNIVILAISATVMLAAFWGVRAQTAVSDAQFLRSMIPHHSSAILMCREGQITDPRIRELCVGIVSSQQVEIDQMKKLLAERS